MLGLLFLLGAFMIIGVILITLCTIGTIVNKIGVTIVANKRKAKYYGLLWVPFVGAWYEGTIIDQLLDNRVVIRIVYLIKSIISFALFIALFAINDRSEAFNKLLVVIFIYFIVCFVLKGVIQTIVMKKQNFNIIGSICINLFIQPFWSFFVIKRVSETKQDDE